MAAEREAAAKATDQQTTGRPKKRKRSKDPNVGFAANHFELVDTENMKRHRVRLPCSSASVREVPILT